MFIWIWAGGRMIGIIGKSGAWPKIFGWKVRCLAENIRLGYDKSTENIWFEIRKILDISGIIKIGMDGQAFGHSPTCIFLRHFIPFALIMVSGFTTIHIPSVRLYRFPTDIYKCPFGL